MSESEEQLLVQGALVAGYAQACVNLNIVAGTKATNLVSNVDVAAWYPLTRFRELERVVVQSYQRSDAIMVKVGIEMMMGWYHYGPGKGLINSAEDFLRFQTGSGGFSSVVRGPPGLVGAFVLERLDSSAGVAVIHSTTPFHRKMECGVLIGGMLAPGQLDYVDVVNDSDPNRLLVEFH